MKVLVTYFSQSGNTEKIAGAICRQASRNHETEMKPLEDVSPGHAAQYDFIFIGSPLHSGALAAPVKEWLSRIEAPPAGRSPASSPILPRPIRSRTWMLLRHRSKRRVKKKAWHTKGASTARVR